MDLSTYQSLTGITVPASQQARVTAQIARTQSMLETLLGYTLSEDSVTTNLYNELGKTTNECACPSAAVEDTSNLLDPDTVTGAYRLYDYNDLDKYLHIDPFSRINKVKLVYIKQGTGTNGVTIRTFDDEEIRIDIDRDGIGKYIQMCDDCTCICDCVECVQLAVDAEWLWDDQDNIPLELKYLWTEMITYYSDNKKDIKSESITSHSYSKFETVSPETEPHNVAVLRRYAGPYGSVAIMPTTGGQGRRVN